MIVSSVYSWLKDLRSHFDIYEENSALKLKNSQCFCKISKEEMFDIPEIEQVLLRNASVRRSVPMKKFGNKKSFAELCLQERAKKAWSVGDAWGVDFQLTSSVGENLQHVENSQNTKRRDSQLTDQTVKDALDQFAFLSDVSDVELESEEKTQNLQNQPVYVNITTINNPKLQKLQQEVYAQRDSTMSLSSTYSFVSCGGLDDTIDSTSSSQSSGTYTVNSLYADFKMDSVSTCSGSTFQTEDSYSYTYSIQDEDDWKREEWRSLCSLGSEAGCRNALKPLKKGKSLDSFNLSHNTDIVQLRHKDKPNRRSVIPVVESDVESHARRAIILPKSQNPQDDTYMNIWECYTQNTSNLKGYKPTPAPRTKFSKPSTPPKPLNRNISKLEIKNARENIVSFAFDETVEYLPLEDVDAEKEVKNDCDNLPPIDVVMWMSRLMREYEPEPEVSSNYDNEIRSVDSQRKDSKREEMMLGQQSPGISWDTNSRDNKFDFHNVKKYKMDNQVIKLNKNEVIENQNGRLLHKNSEGIKTLTEDFEHCKIEQKSPKEHILILPDKKRINLYSKNSKEKLSPAPSPESVRATPAKTDMRNRLMQLFKLRPARDTLLDRGILKNENVFGNTLQALHLKHNQAVPSLVLKCIEYVELPANIDTQGLYRSSASLATLQDIRFAINATHGTNLSSLEKYQTSPDVPSGLLKLFIRELKEPLISNEHFERMFEVCQSDDFNELKYEAIYRIIQTMLPSHKCTLDVLLKHLIKVISHQDKNDMTIEGISICWGQSMITGEEGSDPVLMARRKNEVVELLLRAYNAKDINDSESHLHAESSKEQPTKDVEVNVDVNPIPKPSRIPQRQASVESYMKPKVSIDSNTNTKNNSIHGSKTSIASNSSQPRNSGGLNFGPPGNYVQTVAAKLDNFQIQLSGRARMKSLTKSMESLNKMGSTMSLCDENKQCNRLKFIKTLISKIESTPDFKGVYRGKGKASIVEKLVRKYNKENSKEFGRYLAKADIFVFGQVLQEVTKEIGYVIDFYDMQSLVERKNKTEIKQILNEIPEEFILLFRHFDNLRKKAECKVTIMDDIFQSWWNILIGPPNEKDNLHKERVGRNLTTFEALVQNIIELCAIELKIKSASSFDLRDIDHDMTSVRSSLTRKHSCCNILENRMTSVYEYSKEYQN